MENEIFERSYCSLLVRNINLQLDAGAEKVMILDSGVANMSESYFKKNT